MIFTLNAFQANPSEPAGRQRWLVAFENQLWRLLEHFLKDHVQPCRNATDHGIEQWPHRRPPPSLQELVEDQHAAAGYQYTCRLIEAGERIRQDSEDQVQDDMVETAVEKRSALRILLNTAEIKRTSGAARGAARSSMACFKSIPV